MALAVRLTRFSLVCSRSGTGATNAVERARRRAANQDSVSHSPLTRLKQRQDSLLKAYRILLTLAIVLSFLSTLLTISLLRLLSLSSPTRTINPPSPLAPSDDFYPCTPSPTTTHYPQDISPPLLGPQFDKKLVVFHCNESSMYERKTAYPA